jgi:hypothetical protein
MARLRFVLPTTAEVALTTSLKTVLSLFNAADRRLAIRGFSVAFDGVSSTAGGAEVQLVIHSSSGTFSASTLVKDIRGTTEALGTSGQFNASAEPSTTGAAHAVLRSYTVNQMTGYERAFAQDEEIEVAGGERFGLQIRASSAVNCHAFLNAEE